MSDCDSVGSAGSAATVKRDCPVCKKEFTTRSLFNHIRTKHDAHWFDSMYANEKMLQGYIDKCEPVPFTYTEINDFDEEETKDIYGCLACNNTFTHKARGTTHCNKTKCKAIHIKETKTLKQRVKDVKEKMDAAIAKDSPTTWNREKFHKKIEGYIRWYKYMKNGTLYQTLLTAYNNYKAQRTVSTERQYIDKRNEVYGTSPLKDYCRYMHFPIINPIPEYDCTYNKDAPNLSIQYYDWMRRLTMIETAYMFMKQRVDTEIDIEIYKDMDDCEPRRLYINTLNIDTHQHKLPTL